MAFYYGCANGSLLIKIWHELQPFVNIVNDPSLNWIISNILEQLETFNLTVIALLVLLVLFAWVARGIMRVKSNLTGICLTGTSYSQNSQSFCWVGSFHLKFLSVELPHSAICYEITLLLVELHFSIYMRVLWTILLSGNVMTF